MKKGFTVLSAVIVAIGFAVVFAQDTGAPRQPGKPGGTPYFKGDKKKDKEPDNVRSVEGKVIDPASSAVEGAVVQLKDTKTLRIRSYITLADGAYHFHGLSADTDYEIKATHEKTESQTRRLSVYDSRKKATMDLTLKPKG